MLCWEGRRRQTAAKWLFISITKHTVVGHNVAAAAAAAARHVLLTSFRKSRREQEEEELETTTGDREMGGKEGRKGKVEKAE